MFLQCIVTRVSGILFGSTDTIRLEVDPESLSVSNTFFLGGLQSLQCSYI